MPKYLPSARPVRTTRGVFLAQRNYFPFAMLVRPESFARLLAIAGAHPAVVAAFAPKERAA